MSTRSNRPLEAEAELVPCDDCPLDPGAIVRDNPDANLKLVVMGDSLREWKLTSKWLMRAERSH
jgi:hypothetical protein